MGDVLNLTATPASARRIAKRYRALAEACARSDRIRYEMIAEGWEFRALVLEAAASESLALDSARPG